MSPRRPSVNEEMRRRSRERLLQATVELVEERGYEATTLGDIADRAGAARGLVSYYFPGKRQLLQSATHRLMHRELSAALEHEPPARDGCELLARAVDCVLGMPVRHPVLMRAHMAGILQAEGFVECADQQRLAGLLRDSITAWGSRTPSRTTGCCARCSWARCSRSSSRVRRCRCPGCGRSCSSATGWTTGAVPRRTGFRPAGHRSTGAVSGSSRAGSGR